MTEIDPAKLERAKDEAAANMAALLSRRQPCPTCHDGRWVCEYHPHLTWPTGCRCGGAGKLCPTCLPDGKMP